MTDILKAICAFARQPETELTSYRTGHNRVNSMGEALEEYIKDIFAGTRGMAAAARNERLRQCFSYLGNQNNPPDIIIRGGDAIEVKKIEHSGNSLALNSSYPKARLFRSSSMLTQACRICEENWQEKDIIYAVGVARDNRLSQLAFVYGADYAASADIYERIKRIIHEGVRGINDIELAETKELGRVNRVDPLGITSLRVRGMWQIKNPIDVFSYVYQVQKDKELNFMALIGEKKYASIPAESRTELENLAKILPDLSIENVSIKNPDNPAQMRAAKLVAFFR